MATTDTLSPRIIEAHRRASATVLAAMEAPREKLDKGDPRAWTVIFLLNCWIEQLDSDRSPLTADLTDLSWLPENEAAALRHYALCAYGTDKERAAAHPRAQEMFDEL
ncbi:MAG: hypothetical protein AAF577_12660 [Pseudomonadota bacterium]